MAIDGDVTCYSNTDGTYMYTRSGNFGIDEGGNLVTADGLCVCGWSEYTVNDDGTYTLYISDPLVLIYLQTTLLPTNQP